MNSNRLILLKPEQENMNENALRRSTSGFSQANESSTFKRMICFKTVCHVRENVWFLCYSILSPFLGHQSCKCHCHKVFRLVAIVKKAVELKKDVLCQNSESCSVWQTNSKKTLVGSVKGKRVRYRIIKATLRETITGKLIWEEFDNRKKWSYKPKWFGTKKTLYGKSDFSSPTIFHENSFLYLLIGPKCGPKTSPNDKLLQYLNPKFSFIRDKSER